MKERWHHHDVGHLANDGGHDGVEADAVTRRDERVVTASSASTNSASLMSTIARLDAQGHLDGEQEDEQE